MKNISMVILSLMMLLGSVEVLNAANGQIMFVAKLNTNNEIPLVRGDALGLVTFLISEDRKEILIHGVFTNLTGNVIGCHIHNGKKDENGPVLVDLTSYISGERIKAAVPLPAGLLELAEKGQLYINVHTTAHPNGEMRDQLTIMAEIIIPVRASSLSQVPPDSSNAFGLGTLRFSQNLTRMQYEILPIGLSGPVIAAHIHKGPPGVNGSVIIGLNPGDFITGTIEDTGIVRTVFQEIQSNNAYLNIHTSAKPDGEIRANLETSLIHGASSVLNGDQEIPTVTTNAKAYGSAFINSTLDSIKYSVIYSGITPIGAHIHQAAAGVEGPVMVTLKSVMPGLYEGTEIIGDDQLTSFFKDELYFNIHSVNNPGGEIRGQIENNIMNSFAFDLCGDQENPKKTVNGYGAAYVAINKASTELDYGMIANALNGDATSTRLYDGVFGSNGPTLLTLDLPNTYASKVVPISGTVVAKINADRGYFNIHTAANPSGELRGQVRRSLSCKINTSNQETNFQNISLVQNLSNQSVILETDFDQNMDAQIVLSDLTGKSFQKWNASFSAGLNKSSFQVTSLPSGFYLLNVIIENRIIGVFKFVK